MTSRDTQAQAAKRDAPPPRTEPPADPVAEQHWDERGTWHNVYGAERWRLP